VTGPLLEELPGLMLRDAHRLRRRIAEATDERAFAAVTDAVAAAKARVAARQAAVPAVSYPPQLPIASRVDDLRAAIRDHQVVVVAGETGSGKTTQLPKICLELGLGVRGVIGHTQPRRIAARTVADRIAQELGGELGDVVGYQVRFNTTLSDRTLIKIMTDGILLTEIAHDRLLRRYDTIIIDEAHERSLNIDLLLGYLAQLLPRRPDLKVIITSATIDTERFAAHFSAPGRTVPIIEVSGRSYPVELRYRPLEREDGRVLDQPQAIIAAVRELSAEGPGDILVFCSGEREIRDAADALERGKGASRLADEVIPLYARLSVAEQHRVFAPHPGRRVVLATNVAETSLTVPGIRYVVDTGNARISRYSFRTKVQRLPIERVSAASALQRTGRCGRLEDGICIRLYSQEDHDSRPPFTDPEITRTNLASVLLQMAALGLGDPGEVEDFPFLDAPDRRGIRDGLALLYELGALTRPPGGAHAKLTAIGRQLTRLPIDPRLGRMVLEAGRLGTVREVIVIAAALSIQDPRERPADRQQAADASHARFADPTSDFLGMLNLWRYLSEQQGSRSSSSFRRMCAAEFLHYLRVREWQDLVSQLRNAAEGLNVPGAQGAGSFEAATANPDSVHQALLAGLLSHIGMREGERRDYLGARGTRFAIFPGSALVKKPPRWAMAAELVETSRLWARVVARIEPEWVEPLAEHLITRTYSEPHWEKRRGQVMAYERITLYGLPLVAGRKVGYGKVDPALSRELFIRRALVEGDWRTHHAFFAANQRRRDEVAELEHRVRRRDLLVDDETLFDFYDRRIGPEVVSGTHFDSWWKRERRRDPELLTLTPEALRASEPEVDENAYPDEVARGSVRFPVSYAFEPGAEQDGVTVHVPLALLPQVAASGRDELGWQVPGRRQELIVALLRSLPKALRRSFTPPSTVAAGVLPELDGGEPLLDGLERVLRRRTGVTVPRDAWQLDKLPPDLRPTFAVQDAGGEVIATGKDLTELRTRLAPAVRAAVAEAGGGLERTGLRDWPGGALPRTLTRVLANGRITAYPALVASADSAETVEVQILASETEQESAMWAGTRRLLMLTTPSPVRAITSRLDTRAKLVLAAYPYASVPALLADCHIAAIDELMTAAGGPAWDEPAWDRLQAHVRGGVAKATGGIVGQVEEIVAGAADVLAQLARPAPAVVAEAHDDVRAQLDALVGAGFAARAGASRLPDLRRYVRAMKRRLDQVASDPARDRVRMHEVRQLQAAAGTAPARLASEIRWLIEELRVSLFAQSLGTRQPVSVQRIWRLLDG
jgi:ATP-dependent helicase HrpA